MARNRPQTRRRRNRPRRMANNRRSDARRLGTIAHNALRPVRVPNDPPQRTISGERSHVTRITLVYASSGTAGSATFEWGSLWDDSVILFGPLGTTEPKDSYSVNLNSSFVYQANKSLYGEQSSLVGTIRSIKLWGPLPPSEATVRLDTSTVGGRVPISVTDTGSALSRAKTGVSWPQLYWTNLQATGGTVYATIRINTHTSAVPTILGVCDVSWSVRRI